MKLHICVRVSLLQTLLVLTTVNAQEEQSELEEIIVTATPLGDVLQPSEVLSGDQLLLKGAPSIGETLANELGISSSYFGPAASRPIIRGLGGSRVTILTDSVSTLDASDVSPDHAVGVEPLLADQIEIIRGPTTLLYGSAAAGGVVNVSDSRIPEELPEKTLSGGIEVRADTAAEERGIVARLDGGAGILAWHLDGYASQTENVDIPGFATFDPLLRPANQVRGTLANSYSEKDGFAGGLSWIGDWGYVGASVSGLEQRYGLPGPEAEDGEPTDEPALFEGPLLDMQQTRIDVRGEYRTRESILDSVKFAFGTNAYEHNEIEPSGEIATSFDNDAWQLRLEAVHGPVLGWRGAVGLQIDDRDFAALGEESFIAPVRTSMSGLFLVEEQDFDWGHLHMGARIEALEHEIESPVNYDKTAFSFSAGIGVDMQDDAELILNVSTTERHPGAEELYSNGAHVATRQFEIGLLVTPDSSIVTERSTNIDLGFRREKGAVRWDTSIFYYDIDNYVFQDLDGGVMDGLSVARFAQQDARFYGFEAALSFPLWNSQRFANELRIFTDFVNAELDDGGNLPRIPPLRLGANFEFGQEEWLAGLDVVHHLKQDDISSFNTSSYTLVDLSVLYRLDWQRLNWELFARASNLLDEDARKSTSFLAAFAPLPGRSLRVGIRARF